MLSIDSLLKEPHIYHFEAAPVLPQEVIPQPAWGSPATLPLVLEYRARHAVLSGFAVGRLLDLNPDKPEHAAAIDAVIGYFGDAIATTPALMDSVRTRVVDALYDGSWKSFMMAEDQRAKITGLKPPALDMQPQLSRAWAESMLKVAQKKLTSLQPRL